MSKYVIGNGAPERETIRCIRNAVPSLKDSIGTITKVIVKACEADLNAMPGDFRTFNDEDAKEILGYVYGMMNETSNDKRDISIDNGITLMDDFLDISKKLKNDIRKCRLNVDRCKKFIRVSQVMLNYFDDVMDYAS